MNKEKKNIFLEKRIERFFNRKKKKNFLKKKEKNLKKKMLKKSSLKKKKGFWKIESVFEEEIYKCFFTKKKK